MLVRDVAQALSAQVLGDGSLPIERLVHPAAADRPSDLAVAMTSESFSALANSKAQVAVVLGKNAPPRDKLKAIIVTQDERPALARLTAMFDDGPVRMPGIHPSAIIAPDATIGEDVSIGAYVVIGPRSRIGARSVVLSQVTIGADVTIGQSGMIHPGVRIADRVSMGDRVIIQSNAVIGSDGFSFASEDLSSNLAGGSPGRIHSLGTVIIGNDVEIGAGTCVDRATLEATRIGNHTKIDNLVQIAHNVRIGEGSLICGMVGISGSATIGNRVIVGGGAGISDHVRIGDDARVAAKSGVGTSVAEKVAVSGYPAMPHARTGEVMLFLGRHKRILQDIETSKARLEALEKKLKEKGGDKNG